MSISNSSPDSPILLNGTFVIDYQIKSFVLALFNQCSEMDNIFWEDKLERLPKTWFLLHVVFIKTLIGYSVNY